MLEKEFDTAIIGTTPYSYLLGIELLFSGQKVVLISPPEDEMRSFHEGTGPVTQLEVEFMKHWGKIRQIESLKNLHDYLSPLDVFVGSGHKTVRLGRGTAESLFEIMRKFQSLLQLEEKKEKNDNTFKLLKNDGDESFFSKLQSYEEEFDQYLKKFIEKVYNLKNFKKFNLNSMLTDAPAFMKEFYQHFKHFSAWDESTVDFEMNGELEKLKISQNFGAFWEFKTFLYLVRTLFHKTSQIVSSDFEIFHILIQLFSKTYCLDSKKMISDLKNEYFKLGGMYKETTIGDWDSSAIGPWELELGSFDGVIRPKKIILMGHLLPGSELLTDDSKSFYYRLPFEAHLLSPANKGHYHDLFSEGNSWIYCLSSAEFLGTDYPYFSVRFDKENLISQGKKIKINGELWWKYQEGAKANFFETKIRALLLDFFKEGSFSTYQLEELTLKAPRKWPVWKEFEKNKLNQCLVYNPALYRLPQIKTYDPLGGESKGHLIGRKINKIKYFGPDKREVLGPFSTLLDIKGYCSNLAK